MSLAGCGLRRFEAKMSKIHLFQTKSHTRRALSQSSMAMWRGKRARCYHVAMKEMLLSCGVLAWDRFDAEMGQRRGGAWALSSEGFKRADHTLS
jgi:hypothetical protein